MLPLNSPNLNVVGSQGRCRWTTKTATGYSIICWNYFYLSRQVNNTPEIDARESPLRLIAVHSPASWGHINELGEYDSSGKNSATCSTSSLPQKHSCERAKTGEAIVVKTAADQTTGTIPAAVLVPLCRRTQVRPRTRSCQFLGSPAATDTVRERRWHRFTIQTVDLLARRAGLLGDHRVTEYLFDVNQRLFGGKGNTHATFGIFEQFLEFALAPTTGVDLDFDHPNGAGQNVYRRFGFVGRSDLHTGFYQCSMVTK